MHLWRQQGNLIYRIFSILDVFGFTDIQMKRKAADRGTAGGAGSVQWRSALLHQDGAGLHLSNSPQSRYQTSAPAWTWNQKAALSIYETSHVYHSAAWLDVCPTSVFAEQAAVWGPCTACLLGVYWAGSLVSHVCRSNDIWSFLCKTKTKREHTSTESQCEV